jgi:hypothetical protein
MWLDLALELTNATVDDALPDLRAERSLKIALEAGISLQRLVCEAASFWLNVQRPGD